MLLPKMMRSHAGWVKEKMETALRKAFGRSKDVGMDNKQNEGFAKNFGSNSPRKRAFGIFEDEG
jgi:hypothetical protein